MHKDRIVVSDEMLAFVGSGAIMRTGWPEHCIGLSFRIADASVTLHPDPARAEAMEDADLALVVTAEACRRIFGALSLEGGCWHLPSEMRVITLAVRDCDLPENSRTTLQLAKCIELLCAACLRIAEGTLVSIDAADGLSEEDAHRIVAARRLIDERWREKLTLDGIARACGVNRAKLTRGFRSIFACTVADAIAERRLGGARDLLLATDLPVSSIGYRCGYLSNASFTRAFARRYGQAPTRYRAHRFAA